LIPRPGPPPRLIEGPRTGDRSLYQQQVLDEDTYTEALSHIITRDFFPNLPHIHATNAYLTALTNNDPELLSSAIRRLAALAQEKDDARSGSNNGQEQRDAEESRRRELENMGTPYITMPGNRRSLRTPIGARGWDTPDVRGESSTRRRDDDDDEEDVDELEGDKDRPGPSKPRKRRKPPAPPKVRDDLSLDAFQRNYTSEDNASFVQIVDAENKQRREERWGWAWEAERKAEQRRIEGEEKRRLLLEAATSGNWRVDANGKRLVGGLDEGGRDRTEGEAWRDRKMISSGDQPTHTAAGQLPKQVEVIVAEGTLVLHSAGQTSNALITKADAEASMVKTTPDLVEKELPVDHPLSRVLEEAGLPTTVLVSSEDGAIVPHREAVNGEGEGRGRGVEERERREKVEKDVMGEVRGDTLSLAGSGTDQWGYKTRNNFYFPADANTAPYPTSRNVVKTSEGARQAPPSISHANTRLQDEEEVRPAHTFREGSKRSSSPARSWIDAAVKGTPCGNVPDMPEINGYPLVPTNPTPLPQDLPSLLTWGTLLSTPRALDGNDDPLDLSGPSFKLPESKRRDELGRKLGDKAGRAMNERAKSFTPHPEKTRKSSNGNKTPGQMLPPSTPKRQDNLTPAAKNLLQRSLGMSPMINSGKSGLGISTGARSRSAVMEKTTGWKNT
ncbi:hypothetical protein TREMEDRAFT_13319, partial [Tremella mesenterica DSM 1558]|uniref:uncharacterized protein n=1 Tax=Tremella mesenterica (strain ATCC 24925 / CBS 8224 / DSM 1558 / NBRC 9311 / NRRL Y-6157 / RJB 2259-6 / UBC 559-6) TaxID=578456 RepID=UPI00032C4439